MAIERTFVQEFSTKRRNRFRQVWRLSVRRWRRRRLRGRMHGLKPPYLSNTHGPADKVGNCDLAFIICNLFFVDEDESVVLYAVTISIEV
jgi:hypothetical protein